MLIYAIIMIGENMKKNKKHKFSLVELICIIVIVALLIVMSIFTTLRTLEKNNQDNKLLQEEIIINACEKYIIKNPSEAPKAVGDSVNIYLSKLEERNYLTEDIYNFNNKTCMGESYVRVYKLNSNEYSYLPYLICHKGKKIEKYIEELPNPSVDMIFIDSKDNTSNNLIFNNINESRIYIDMDGGVDSFGRKIEIYTYEINIYMRTKENSNLGLAYSSGIVDANRRFNDTIDKKVMSYVNAKDAVEIKVVVRVTNTLGGVCEVTSIAQANNNGN